MAGRVIYGKEYSDLLKEKDNCIIAETASLPAVSAQRQKRKKAAAGQSLFMPKIPLGGFDFQSRHFLLRFIRFGGS